jgi:SAM-dependent methyltransferase
VPAAVSVADALPFADASFDFATSFQCLYYVKDIDRAADELLRVLRPGSVAIVSVSGYLHLLNEHFRASRLPQVHGRAWWERLFASVGFDLLDVNLPPRYHTPSLRGQVSHFVRPYQFFRLQVPSPQAQA